MDELEKKSNIREVIEWILCLLIAVVLALIVRHYIFTPTEVRMQSMMPTLMPGERLFLDRLSITLNKEIKRGDIITFEKPTVIEPNLTDFDKDNQVAIYSDGSKNILSKFIYYVLEFGKDSYIKRVIGVAGDHILIENGKVYLNGEELQEDYLPEGRTTERAGMYYDLVVPEGYVFAMGDNRAESMDCRKFGCIPIKKIESKVLVRFWPFSKFGDVN